MGDFGSESENSDSSRAVDRIPSLWPEDQRPLHEDFKNNSLTILRNFLKGKLTDLGKYRYDILYWKTKREFFFT